MDIEMEKVSVQRLMEEVASALRPLVRERGSELVLEGGGCEGEIMTDPGRVRQVLLNLTSQALEAGDAHPVAMRCAEEADGGVRIELTGRGLDTAAASGAPQVLDSFIRLDDSAECDTELEFCVRMADIIGAKLEVASSGEESTYRLTLPVAPHGA